MSSNRDDQTQKLNKKQRRKQTRCNQLSTRPPDEESADPTPAPTIVQTDANQASSIVNGVQALVLNIPEQVWLRYTLPESLFIKRTIPILECIINIVQDWDKSEWIDTTCAYWEQRWIMSWGIGLVFTVLYAAADAAPSETIPN